MSASNLATPLKRTVSATVDQSSNRTDLLRIITSPADELSGGTNIDDFERP